MQMHSQTAEANLVSLPKVEERPTKLRKLKGKMRRQFQVMQGGDWFTLEQLREIIGGLDSTISANIRTYRKEPYGSHTVLCELVDIDNPNNQTYKYKLIPNQETVCTIF
jgi:hypothetical protein